MLVMISINTGDIKRIQSLLTQVKLSQTINVTILSRVPQANLKNLTQMISVKRLVKCL